MGEVLKQKRLHFRLFIARERSARPKIEVRSFWAPRLRLAKSDHLTPSPDRGDETAGQGLERGRGLALQNHKVL